MTVIDFCNRLIGPEQAERLNADSIYTLLMSCYLHDIGMAISEKQYEDALKEIPFGDYFQKNPDAEKERVVRDFHQEFSAAFVRRYARMLEIPSAEHEFAIIEVCRGHRRTDLFDVSQFPPHYTVPGGNEIPLPYLAALIRLADEIDVVAARNPIMLYDIESFTDAEEIAYHKQHEAVKELIIEEDAFILHAVHTDEDIERMIAGTRDKMEKTLLYCREAARKQSSFRITQKEVRILYLD
jgi:rhodanese-related sulfurtransferase